jgi:hypothetical protein
VNRQEVVRGERLSAISAYEIATRRPALADARAKLQFDGSGYRARTSVFTNSSADFSDAPIRRKSVPASEIVQV